MPRKLLPAEPQTPPPSLPELGSLAHCLETLEWAADVLGETTQVGPLAIAPRAADVRRVCQQTAHEARERLLDGFDLETPSEGRFARQADDRVHP